MKRKTEFIILRAETELKDKLQKMADGAEEYLSQYVRNVLKKHVNEKK